MKKIIVKNISRFSSWNNIAQVNDFTYPWQTSLVPATSFRCYHDEQHLRFQFTAFGPKPLVYVHDNNKLEVRHSERVEIFFRSDAKMQPYYCLEMDPHGRVLDYKAIHYRKFDREWSWPDDLGIEVEQREDAYELSGRMNLTTLTKLGLLKDKQLQVGLYRGHCIDIKEDQGTIMWSTWVDPETAEPDFHVPESFGLMELE